MSKHGAISYYVTTNGQSGIRVDWSAIHGAVDQHGEHGSAYHHHRRDGFRLSCVADKKAARAELVALCPGASVRITKHGINVKYPAALLALREEMDREWQALAADATLTHRDLQNWAINHPGYRAQA